MTIAKFYTLICLCLLCAKVISNSVGQKCNPSDTTLHGCDNETQLFGQKCNPSDTTLQQCDNKTQLCNSSTNTCDCIDGYSLVGDQCVSLTTTPGYEKLVEDSNGSLVAGIFIPLFLILIVIFSIYIGRKYEVLKWARNKINQRNSNYSEFMIGQDLDDDPPLA